MATSDKYDRQLRLWGASGQRALSETCVILVRATAAGTETLKNLVLPGVGSFLIVDDVNAVVTPQDVATNFFTTKTLDATTTTTTNVSRASLACEQLQELNPDVQGAFIDTTKLEQCLSSVEAWQEYIVDPIQTRFNISYQQILVVASDLEPPLKYQLAKICQATKTSTRTSPTKLILVQAYGLMGIVRLQTTPDLLPIMDPKPRDALPDLRLVKPFDALQQMLHSTITNQTNNLDLKGHKHVPYPLILLKIQQLYRDENDGRLPQTLAEKQAFVQLIKDSVPKDLIRQQCLQAYYQEQQQQQQQQQHDGDDGGGPLVVVPPNEVDAAELEAAVQKAIRVFPLEQDNYREAIQNAYLAYAGGDSQPTMLDIQHVEQLLQRAQTALTTASASNNNNKLSRFVLLLQALLEFAAHHNGQAPLQGTIPDMTASTELYVQLQTLYRNQAAQDWQEIKTIVQEKQQQQRQQQNRQTELDSQMADNDDNYNDDEILIISDDDLTTFCQNVHYLDLIEGRSLYDEVYGDCIPDEITQELVMALQEAAEEQDNRPLDMVPLLWYLGLQACDLFFQHYQRYPGTNCYYAADVAPLQGLLEQGLKRYGLLSFLLDGAAITVTNKIATELVRYGNAEVHNIAALIGGVASQEAVKLITGQYTPLQYAYIYNGIASTGGVYKF